MNKEKAKKRNNEWYKKHPWARAYFNAGTRCKAGRYARRGIKMLMTIDDFKKLWFRDKAWLLKRPSIDRINHNSHYAPENCRWIEWEENTFWAIVSVDQLTLDGKYLRTFKTLRSASDFLKVKHGESNISEAARNKLIVCRNKRNYTKRTAYGYKWRISRIGYQAAILAEWGKNEKS